MPESPDQTASPFWLHIGGKQVKPGWKIFDIAQRAEVDFVGDCRDLSRFSDASIDRVYASHVYEHLSYVHDLPGAFVEVHRVLKPGGVFYIGVPDLEKLCRLFLDPRLDGNARFQVMRYMFGGQAHENDFHRAGLTLEFIAHLLSVAKFGAFERVETLGMFDDASTLRFQGELISLNVIATK